MDQGLTAWLASDRPETALQARLGGTYHGLTAFLRNPLAVIGLLIIFTLIVCAALAPLLAPFTPDAHSCWGVDSPTCGIYRHSAIDLPPGTLGDNSAAGQLGHFLVRATPTGIPEPTTIAPRRVVVACSSSS